MPDPILHHYDLSPYAEKIRLALGLKGMAWRSVQAPMVSWGSMLNQILDFQSFSAAPWMMAPVGMIVISVLAFNAFGDGLRDAIDPYSDA